MSDTFVLKESVKISRMEENNSLTQYEESVNKASSRTSELIAVLRNAETVNHVVGNMPAIVQSIKEIRMAQIASRHQLEAMKLQSDHNLHKFDRLIRGAEMRLDRQLNEMSEIRQQMRKFTFGSSSGAELTILAKLSEQLDKIHESVMYELRMLYNI